MCKENLFLSFILTVATADAYFGIQFLIKIEFDEFHFRGTFYQFIILVHTFLLCKPISKKKQRFFSAQENSAKLFAVSAFGTKITRQKIAYSFFYRKRYSCDA